MSRTPGKTKHLQTLEMPEVGVTLCDCPGLVFPSVVATKAHLTINGTVPITELRDWLSPVTLIITKMGLSSVLEHYCFDESTLRESAAKCGVDWTNAASATESAHAFLAALAVSRQHFLRVGVPDENWGAQRMLQDFVTGALLHCELPPGTAPSSVTAAAPSEVVEAAGGASHAPPVAAAQVEGSDSDFSDVDAFLRGEANDDSKSKKKKGQAKKRR